MSDKARIVLDGVDRYRLVEPVFECVRVVLSYLGASYSPAYIQGISGAAFRIGGICPCAPTVSTAMWTDDLIDLLGYEVHHHRVAEGIPSFNYDQLVPVAKMYEENGNVLPKADALEQAELRTVCEQLGALIDAVKEGIRAGRPVIVWHAFTYAECDVVAGFDEEKGTFVGRGSYAGVDDGYVEAPWGRMVTTAYVGGLPSAIVIGERVRPFDARGAEIAALQGAVRHARSQNNADKLGGEKWVMLDGLLCYDRWIDDWRDPQKKRTSGDSYCLGVYRTTHRAAGGFMREIAPKYPQAQPQLERAAEALAAEADALDAAVLLLGWEAPEGPDPERNALLVPLLRQARDGYACAIVEIERVLEAIGDKSQ
jgi:hypothetical protein